MNALITKITVVLVLIAVATIGVATFIRHEQAIGYQRRVDEEQVQLNKDLQQARADTERLFRLRDKAIYEGVEREKQIILERDAALSASAGLRNTLAEYRRRLSSAPLETARAYAETGLKFLDECQERYRTVAERADGYFNDWRMMDEAWPDSQNSLK